MSPRRWYYFKLLAFSAFPTIPPFVLVGYYADTPWVVPAFAFIGIPVLDLLIGSDRTQPLERPAPRVAVAWLRMIPRLYVFLWLGTLIWGAHTLASEATGLMAVWLVVSLAMASAFATCVAHELLHWPSAFDRGLARLIMGTVAYGPFPFEHLHHHAKVGLPTEGTTPPLGQSVWSFLVKNVLFTLRSGWKIERRRQLAKQARRDAGDRSSDLARTLMTMKDSVLGKVELDESLLTGESTIVRKQVDPVDEDTEVTDRASMAFMGTTVASGKAVGYVVATGMASELGHIAEIVQEEEEPETPLQLRMQRFARIVAGAAVGGAAIAFGIGSTARIITGAALIIVAVFSGFAAGDLVMFQQMGFGIAVALLIDATLVRSVLVPAVMQLLGTWNWYLPGWLQWLPHMEVEGPHTRPVGSEPASAQS